MLASLLFVVSLAVAGLTAPANDIDKRVRAEVFTRCTVPNTVALTFDDGPYNYLSDIVDLLDSNDAKGTFFFNGNNWGCIYSTSLAPRVKYAYDHGHQVASHTWSHQNLTTLSWDQIHDEMWRVEQALQRITGATPAFMRPPYGSYNNLVLDASGARGQTVVNWDFDTQDSASASPATQKGLIDGLIGRHPNTILSLEHETYSSTAYDVLPYFIQKVKAAGYHMVTVAECLGSNPYQRVESPSARDSAGTVRLIPALFISLICAFEPTTKSTHYILYYNYHLHSNHIHFKDVISAIQGLKMCIQPYTSIFHA
ncbi:hypothetical protein BDQ17DRAFT_1412305 [Cyathus striatus]|nr:hypothetical protein BDQ17DRAFT_1412305 [Cyathus striatus]